jgi:hypothetical protein
MIEIDLAKRPTGHDQIGLQGDCGLELLDGTRFVAAASQRGRAVDILGHRRFGSLDGHRRLSRRAPEQQKHSRKQGRLNPFSHRLNAPGLPSIDIPADRF